MEWTRFPPTSLPQLTHLRGLVQLALSGNQADGRLTNPTQYFPFWEQPDLKEEIAAELKGFAW